MNQRDFKKAIEFYNKALTDVRADHGEKEELTCYIYLFKGICYGTKDPYEALECMNRSLRQLNKIGKFESFETAFCIENMANVYHFVKDEA